MIAIRLPLCFDHKGRRKKRQLAFPKYALIQILDMPPCRVAKSKLNVLETRRIKISIKLRFSGVQN